MPVTCSLGTIVLQGTTILIFSLGICGVAIVIDCVRAFHLDHHCLIPIRLRFIVSADSRTNPFYPIVTYERIVKIISIMLKPFVETSMVFRG